MKFPLKERPFDLVQLSPERLAELELTAQRVVEANLNEFHDFVHVHNRVMPKDQFKVVKKRENVTIYKELSAPAERTMGPLDAPSRSSHAPFMLNKLVAVGTVRGRMDDMLLGTAVRDPASVVVKTSYVNDEIVDCSVLHEMQGASPQDPFRFLALKWIVKSKPSGINSVVAPRDMIVMQSSGLIASEGIGFHLLHSVDAAVPECPSLEPQHGILRSRISTMFIFRQLAPDVIEVYTTNYVEPNGSAPEAVVLLTSAKSMGASWKSLGYSHHVKLSWILRNKEAYMGLTHAHLQKETMNTGDDCELCHKKATLTGRLDDCSLCDARVCSRCRVTKKLSKANRRLELKTDKFEFCKTCLFRVVNEDSVRIAAEMNVGVPITPWRHSKDPSTRAFSFAGTSDTGSSHRRGSRDTISTTSSGSRSHVDLDREINAFAYTNLVGRRTQAHGHHYQDNDHAMRAPSIASTTMSAYTDLDFDGHEFHDTDHEHDDLESIATLEDDEQQQQQQQDEYRAYMAHEHERKKQELHAQYQRQLREMDAHAGQQILPYSATRSSSTGSRTSSTSRRAPVPVAMPPRAKANKMDLDELRGPVDPAQDHFRNLYAQMQTLQLAAEKTFELTKDNERKLSQGGRGSSRREWAR